MCLALGIRLLQPLGHPLACLDRRILLWSLGCDARRQRLNQRVVVDAAEARDAQSLYAGRVDRSMGGRHEHVVRPHGQLVPDVADVVAVRPRRHIDPIAGLVAHLQRRRSVALLRQQRHNFVVRVRPDAHHLVVLRTFLRRVVEQPQDGRVSVALGVKKVLVQIQRQRKQRQQLLEHQQHFFVVGFASVLECGQQLCIGPDIVLDRAIGRLSLRTHVEAFVHVPFAALQCKLDKM